MALLDKVSHGESILVGVATRKTLVRHIKKGKVALGLDGLADLLPLLLGGVDAGRVVGAGMEQKHAALGGGFDVGQHALEIQTDGLLVVVAVLLDLETRIAEDGLVVGPRRRRDVDGLLAGVPARQEGGGDAQGAGARDGLGDDETLEGGGALAVG